MKYNKFGPVSISESGNYDSIKSMGPLTINAPAVTAESIKAMGPASLKSTLEADKININGPGSGEGSIKVGTFKINGPFKYAGDISIKDAGKINGPCKVTGSFTGNSEVKFTINGPLEFQHMSDFNYIKVNGPTTGFSIKNVGTLGINGKVQLEEIEVSEQVTINLGKGETVIKSIKGGNIEIGILEDTNSFFGRLFKNVVSEDSKVRVGIIESIESNGVVELDNVKVKKVIAKELFAGENTEIGEFIELTE